ncbi:MAG: response regulator [Nitrospirae bacterium]|nr:response regulator [Nitrospirota bacterium]
MSKNILIIEDSSTMRSMIAAIIEEMGEFVITEAASGFEALKILPTKKFDLIITDINMPDINGLEIVNFVKTHSSYKGIPLIIVTTERAEEDRKKGLALGASEYLTKPFKVDDLQKAVRRVIG